MDERRNVWVNSKTGEYWIQVPSNLFMLDSDYIEGGTACKWLPTIDGKLELVGRYTNDQIYAGEYIKEG